MRKMIICRGIPGSGKSTWAIQFLKDNPKFLRVNRDSIRRGLIGDAYDLKIEDLVTQLQSHQIESIIGKGKNVLIDNTNVKESYVNEFLKIAERIGDVIVEEKIFDTPFDVCCQRNESRKGVEVVPMAVMKAMNDNFQKISKTERTWKFYKKPKLFLSDTSLPDALLVDVDGTLALNYTRNPFEWNRVLEDSLNIPIAEIVRTYHKNGTKVIIFSGRDAICKDLTEKWLKDNNVPYDEIYMRAIGDMRKDSIVKVELYKKYVEGKNSILFMLDDRDQVIREFRELGLPVLQVNYGNF
jgi:predicted kinase